MQWEEVAYKEWSRFLVRLRKVRPEPCNVNTVPFRRYGSRRSLPVSGRRCRPDGESWMSKAGCRTLGAERWVPKVGCRKLDVESWVSWKSGPFRAASAPQTDALQGAWSFPDAPAPPPGTIKLSIDGIS